VYICIFYCYDHCNMVTVRYAHSNVACNEISDSSLHSVDWYSSQWRSERCSCNMLLLTYYCRHEVTNEWPDQLTTDCIPSQLVHDQLEDFSLAEYHKQTNINIRQLWTMISYSELYINVNCQHRQKLGSHEKLSFVVNKKYYTTSSFV